MKLCSIIVFLFIATASSNLLAQEATSGKPTVAPTPVIQKPADVAAEAYSVAATDPKITRAVLADILKSVINKDLPTSRDDAMLRLTALQVMQNAHIIEQNARLIALLESKMTLSTNTQPLENPKELMSSVPLQTASIFGGLACLVWKTNPLYWQGVAALKIAKSKGLIRNKDHCKQIANHTDLLKQFFGPAAVLGKSAFECACDQVF